VPISCILGTEIPELREKVINFTKSMPFYKELWPRSFLQLRQAIDQEKHASTVYLTWKMYQNLAELQYLKGDLLEVATTFLHETGVIRYFGNVKLASSMDENSLQSHVLLDTVFISAPWIIDAMKGLIRHDQDALLRYFSRKKDKSRMRRLRRLMFFGILHEDLASFLWPEDAKSSEYWGERRDASNDSKGDGEQWLENVVVEQDDYQRIFALLEGFDIMVPRMSNNENLKEFIVPSLIAPSQKRLIPLHTLTSDKLDHWSIYKYPALPPGAFDRLITRGYSFSRQANFR
jgi:hypothetical protein